MARTEFIGPAQGSEEPAKSKMRLSFRAVTVRAMVRGSLTTPSLSMKAREVQGPSGMSGDHRPHLGARRGRGFSAMAAVTVASP